MCCISCLLLCLLPFLTTITQQTQRAHLLRATCNFSQEVSVKEISSGILGGQGSFSIAKAGQSAHSSANWAFLLLAAPPIATALSAFSSWPVHPPNNPSPPPLSLRLPSSDSTGSALLRASVRVRERVERVCLAPGLAAPFGTLRSEQRRIGESLRHSAAAKRSATPKPHSSHPSLQGLPLADRTPHRRRQRRRRLLPPLRSSVDVSSSPRPRHLLSTTTLERHVTEFSPSPTSKRTNYSLSSVHDSSHLRISFAKRQLHRRFNHHFDFAPLATHQIDDTNAQPTSTIQDHNSS